MHTGRMSGVSLPRMVLITMYVNNIIIGFNFVGALAYADDIVLIAPTPSSALRQLLLICHMYAVEYDIMFNANKSKFMYFGAQNRRSLHNAMKECIFEIGGNRILRVYHFRTLVILLRQI